MKDTRKKLLRTAARLFAQKGFSGTSVRDIVAAAGINVSAVHYYFGNKRNLYRETLRQLVEDHRESVWGKTPLPSAQELASYSYEQSLALLHQMFDRLLEHSLSQKLLPLERIFTRVELESASTRKMLLSYMAPFQELPYKLLAKVTNLPENSPEMVFVSHSIFGQILLSECHRLVILNKLSVKHISPELRQQIKNLIWKNTVAILNSYKKGTEKQ